MENKLQLFQNEEFGKVRVLEIDGQPWFVGRDVTDILGYHNSRDALSKRVDDEDKGVANCDTLGGKQELAIINESGLYALILSSKLPKAKAFKRWVTNDILPSIRKYGAYVTDETLDKILESPAFATRLFGAIAEERRKNIALETRLAELAPKVRYYDVILQSRDAVQVSLIAKDYGMSAASFNKLLHGLKIQYKIGNTWLLYQQHADKGYTVSRTYHINEYKSTMHTYWTQRGRLFLYDTLKEYGVIPLMEAHSAAFTDMR